MGFCGKVVLTLCKTIENPEESFMHFNNSFTSLELIEYLNKMKQLASFGTIRSIRFGKCPLDNSGCKVGWH